MATVRAVVRDVVGETAPDELVLLDGVLALDDERVGRALTGRERRSPLGFGAAEATALVAPVVWLVVDEVARRTVGGAVDSVAARAGSAVRRLWRRPADEPRTVPPLTADR